MKKTLGLCSAILAASLLVAPTANAFDPVSAGNVFARLAAEPEMGNPSVSLLDLSTGEIVFESNAFSQRKPASTMKILAAAATLKHLDPNYVFSTTVSLGPVADSLVINGDYDPWISFNNQTAVKMKRTSFLRLAFNSLSAAKKNSGGSVKNLKIYYNDLYANEVATFKAFYKKRGVKASFIKVTEAKAQEISGAQILFSDSPTVKEIMNWFLLWSDNELSERMARLSAKAAGFEFNDKGVATTFDKLLTEMEIDPSKIIVKDASGLSRENKVTANLMAKLLYKVHSDPLLATLIEGLPVSGESGTLQRRYIQTAPEAIGLVKAKTGTLTGTVSLAGYVQSGEREYAFVVIADKIRRTYSASEQARKTLDRYLAKIAAPLFTPVVDTTTAVTDLQTL
jgi:D-alanyl-D-alanine carboxypeptidase/D-alanyl-D-alanine-endopeptidase (penicillin-binding protein 4)